MTPLVLSGPPRSGTTLLSALFDGHTQINWFPDEGFFFEHLYLLGREYHEQFIRAATLSIDGLVEGLRDRSLMPLVHRPLSDFPSLHYPWSEERFLSVLKEKMPTSIREVWYWLRDAYVAGFGFNPRRYVLIKAADFGRSVFGALEYFEEARGIIIVREPISMLNSLEGYRRKRGAKLLTWPTLVDTVVGLNRLAELANESSRVRIVRYEDLIERREVILLELCEWLGLPLEAITFEPTMMGRPWSNNSSFVTGERGIAPLPDKRDMVFSKAEQDYIVWATTPFRQRFGYH